VEELEEFGDISPYVLNNWLSAYSDDILQFINETSNVSSDVFKNKYMIYEYYYNIIPKMKYKKINYPKPKKSKEIREKKKIPDEIIDLLRKNLEISKTETKYLIEREVIDISKWS
jgi:hypothetical protein